MIRKGKLVIYPSYFDRNLSRKMGRRVPLELSVKSPTVDKLMQACKKIGLDVEVEEGRYPKTWWRKGRVLVSLGTYGSKKASLLRRIARAMQGL